MRTGHKITLIKLQVCEPHSTRPTLPRASLNLPYTPLPYSPIDHSKFRYPHLPGFYHKFFQMIFLETPRQSLIPPFLQKKKLISLRIIVVGHPAKVFGEQCSRWSLVAIQQRYSVNNVQDQCLWPSSKGIWLTMFKRIIVVGHPVKVFGQQCSRSLL